MPAKSKRDTIRSKIFASGQFKTVDTEILGQKVTVRQPSIGDISRYITASTEDKKNQLILLMIDYCFVPGTTEKIFEHTDYDSIEELPTGQWMMQFQQVWSELAGLDTEEATKNSEETDSNT